MSTTTPAATDQSSSTAVELTYPPPRQAWYVVGVLMLVYMCSFVDRQILNLMVRPIKKDLDITDTQAGFLIGVGFAVFYAFAGIPFGRLADVRSRRTIIAVGLAVWSFFTALMGLARSYTELLLCRVGVGIGQGALSPAAYSLITDYFPAHRRGTALGAYSMGIYIGSGLSFMVGGALLGLAADGELWNVPLLGPTRPWQVVFLIVGPPGLLMTGLLYTFREPVRHVRAAVTTLSAPAAAHPSLGEVLRYFQANWKTLACHNLRFALLSFSAYSASAWIPAFLTRHFAWHESRAGLTYGLIVAIFGTLGVLCGGWLTDWLSHRGYRDAAMRSGLLFGLIWFPTGMIYPITTDSTWVTLLLIPTAFASSGPFGAAVAAIQQAMPGPMRGQASALYLFAVNLLGMGCGPLVTAMITDYFQDAMKVNLSLLISGTVSHVLAVVLLAAGLRPFRDSLERLKAWTVEHSRPVS